MACSLIMASHYLSQWGLRVNWNWSKSKHETFYSIKCIWKCLKNVGHFVQASCVHLSDVILSAMAYQLTSPTIVYSRVLFRCKSKETSKLRVTGLCEWNSPVAGEFPAQRASNAENVSIWWCHHVINGCAITMTSHARHGESNHRQIYCFAQQLVQASNKGNIKVFLTAGPFMRRNRRWLVDSFTRGQQCGQHFHIMTSYFFSLPDITSWLSSCRTTLRWSGQNGKIT